MDLQTTSIQYPPPSEQSAQQQPVQQQTITYNGQPNPQENQQHQYNLQQQQQPQSSNMMSAASSNPPQHAAAASSSQYNQQPASAPQQQQFVQGIQHQTVPQQQQQQQQSYAQHPGLNGGWQSDRDIQERRTMIAKIVHLLQQRKPNAPQEWLKKLPQMAKRLEESLYRSAKSFDEYNDASTLKNRLQQLAINIGMKTKKMQQQQAMMQQQRPPQPGQPMAQQPSTVSQPMQMQPQPLSNQQPQPQMMQQQSQPQQSQMVNLSDINPVMAPQQGTQQRPLQQLPQQLNFQPSAPLASAQPPQQQQQAVMMPVEGANGAASAAAAAASRTVSDRQQVLRHQQQRLLLLRHAAKCQHDDGRCPVTPHCAGMKRLWKHIAECKNQKCLVPHCVSSRYVLSHYHRCKDVRCPVCGPVREAIHRSHEKQKQMQALKQSHRQVVQQQSQQGQLSQGTSVAPTAIAMEPATKRRRTNDGGLGPASDFASQQMPQLPQQQQMIQQQQMSMQQPQPPGAPASRPNMVMHPGRPAVANTPGLAFSNGQVIMPKHSGPKPREDHTLINCFSVEQIETHLASLNQGLQLNPVKLKTKCMDVLKIMQSHQHGWVFNSPVDPVELGLPDYFEVIKKPMDLGTIRKKVENGVYHKLDEFEYHCKLTFDNAMLYNPEGSVVYNMAKEMKDNFEEEYAKMMEQVNREEDIKRRNGEACSLCGCEKLLFEPPVFYCNGMNCPSKRIRRNSYYYVGGNNQYHWCHQCFQELRDNLPIDLGDIQVKKEELTKKKNDEVHEESWVQCDRCERWVHQICALFNTRQNKDQRSEYACPRCTISERKRNGQLDGTSTTPMAEELPRTKLSEFLEHHVRKRVDDYMDRTAKEKSEVEKTSIEEAMSKIQMGGHITIRQVTSMDRRLEVRERMKKRYAFKNYPDEFTYRCKCIVVFQNLDGVDVVLFGLYVYEHDEKNPAPNSRTVYVSYLDSVHYMRPRSMRTLIYHEILIAYLDYVRRKGYATAHIWACPPLKGDDYILYAKPEDQKTPRDDRLRQWYIDMLVECQRRGIVGTVTNMYDLYFADPKNDATIVPYMEGDYFPAEVENIIKDLEEGKSGKKSSSEGSKKKEKAKAKEKKKSGRSGTRSTGYDEEALKASGFFPAGQDQKSLEEGARDYVMMKLGETIQPMKESFIVAHLGWRGTKEEYMTVPKEIQEYRDQHNITWKLPEVDDDELITGLIVAKEEEAPSDKKNGEGAPAATTLNAPNSDGNEAAKTLSSSDASAPVIAAPIADGLSNDSEAKQENPDCSNSEVAVAEQGDAAPETTLSAGPQPMEEDSKESGAEATEQSTDPSTDGVAVAADQNLETPSNAEAKPEEVPSQPGQIESQVEEAKSNGIETTTDPPSEAAPTTQVPADIAHRKGKFAAMAAKKRDVDGNVKSDDTVVVKEENKKSEKELKNLTTTDSRGRIVKVLDDDEEELDCEFLNNRQAFLNLCQGNHYQFDMLRRAKHSSMMVLWHLHNRDAPKFVQQCATCSREILAGYRFHCSICADFDQCQDCVQNPKIPRHPHQLKPMPVGSGQQQELTAAQRKERQRSIQLHMTLLLHAATCNSSKCPSANCTKMKGLLKHGAQCQVKASGGCNVCKRIWALLQIHARQCKANKCPVPNCMAIRERFRQLKKQQQAMDDRRRQEMNRAYRGKR
ncbi:hypothetical protein MPSEU_000074500 [Mayamaea pseudoterrestris]|nr:hypothetical protein MPSEU_000074500 [Mayamaea pseudoterrestris]